MSQVKKTTSILMSQIDRASEEMNKKSLVTPERVSLRSAIKKLQNSINHMISQGYGWAAIAEELKKQGIEINSSTLKTYTYENNKTIKMAAEKSEA